MILHCIRTQSPGRKCEIAAGSESHYQSQSRWRMSDPRKKPQNLMLWECKELCKAFIADAQSWSDLH